MLSGIEALILVLLSTGVDGMVCWLSLLALEIAGRVDVGVRLSVLVMARSLTIHQASRTRPLMTWIFGARAYIGGRNPCAAWLLTVPYKPVPKSVPSPRRQAPSTWLVLALTLLKNRSILNCYNQGPSRVDCAVFPTCVSFGLVGMSRNL